jgi:hypothetical protein
VDIDYISAALVVLPHISPKNTIDEYAEEALYESKTVRRFSLYQNINKLKFVRNISR